MSVTPLPGPPPLLDALVVGAGISGLVAALKMQDAGLRVGVIDAGLQPGGVIRSVARDGFLWECGPNSVLDTTPLLGELVARLGLQAQWRPASAAAARRYVLCGGRLVAVPTSPGAMLATPLFSWRAKLALLREPFVAAASPVAEESIADFVRRRLGCEFLEHAIDPFVAGVYAGDPAQISVAAAFPKLHALEQRYGSLLRGQLLGARERRRAPDRSRHTARSYAFTGGMQTLTDALAAAAGPVAQACQALRFQRDGDGSFTVHTLHDGAPRRWRARALVLATPADATAGLLREHAGDAAAALGGIGYAPLASIASAYRRDDIAHALDGFGALVPRIASRHVLGMLFSSSMFDGRAPAGHVLLTSFVGGMRQPELAALPEDRLSDIVQAEHAALLGARAPALFHAVTRWPRAIPQYTLGHLGRVARACSAMQALPGLFFCANWKGGVSVGDCVKNGHGVAQDVAAHLAHRQQPGWRLAA